MLNRLPGTFIILLLLTTVTALYAGFQIDKIVGTIEVKKSVFVSPATFSMELFSCQTKAQVLTYKNVSPVNQFIEVILEVMPDGDGLTMSGDEDFTLEAADTKDVSVFITASCDIEPKTFEVHVEPERVNP